MKQIQKFKLTIPKPCHEDWDKMFLQEKGRYCSHCEKEVIDFKNYSENELKAWMKSNRGKVCGQFRPDQLDFFIWEENRKTTAFLRARLVMASFLALLTVQKATAGPNLKSLIYTHSKSFKEQAEVKAFADAADSLIIIKGAVMDQQKRSLAAVSIRIKNSKAFTATDGNGHFLLSFKKMEDSMKTITLIISYIGYNTISRKVNIKQAADVSIVLKESDEVMMGEVVIVSEKFR